MKKLVLMALVIIWGIGIAAVSAQATDWDHYVGLWKEMDTHNENAVCISIHDDGNAIVATSGSLELGTIGGYFGNFYIESADGRRPIALNSFGRLQTKIERDGIVSDIKLRAVWQTEESQFAGEWQVSNVKGISSNILPEGVEKMTLRIYGDGFGIYVMNGVLMPICLHSVDNQVFVSDKNGEKSTLILEADGKIRFAIEIAGTDVELCMVRQDASTSMQNTTTSTPKPTTTPKSTASTQPTATTEQQKVVCSTCSGKGKLNSRCSNCGGDGKTSADCSACRNGDVACSSCGGSGKKSCSTCGGDGRSRCTLCSGKGERAGRKCTTCSGSGQKKCTNCNGKGTKNCSKCYGKGKEDCRRCTQGWVDVQCSVCRGKGYYTDTCWSCKGTGEK